ncbi:MAG: radical SAM protein [Patescibacteria group bacterium]
MPANSFYFQWHITDVCGNRCKHCYITEFNKQQVSLATAEGIMADMKGCCEALDAEATLSVTGGDPLTHPEIWAILKEARKFTKKLAVLGNPELLSAENIGKLKNAGVDKYQFSLDGMESTHDAIRRPGSFKRTLAGIRSLVQAGIHVVVNSTVSGINYHEMVDVMKLSYDLGASKWSFARWVPESGTCGISAQEYSKFLKEIFELQKSFKSDGTTFLAGDSLMNSVILEPAPCDGVTTGCALGSSALCVLPDNTVMACRRHKDSMLGKWKKSGDLLDFFLFNPKMEVYRQTDKIVGCNKCGFKSQCRGCRALAYVNNGDTFGTDPQCVLINKQPQKE